ncbi:MAG: hypothetical protein DRP45_04440 [Candidatus Zixiibacteriota bacterium]|nr:MAG: hypothetical protein DRP45_04440 [candidate division Zixibacteria bacterium]
MATHTETALYSPYGAFELKARYQRNFLYGTLIMVAVVILIVAVSWLISKMGEVEAISDQVHVIKTVAELGPPPTIAKKPPQVKVEAPQLSAPKVGIPKPVADDEVLDEDVVLATRDEMAEIVAPDITTESSGDIVVDIDEDEFFPGMDDFVAVEKQAEFIDRVKPKYPRLAEQAGIEGKVWIKVLVDLDGSVREAVIYKSSGTAALDKAALDVAKENKFKPAIQNGRPVRTWVAYDVDFIL